MIKRLHKSAIYGILFLMIGIYQKPINKEDEMTKLVIATHGYFSKGLKMSTEFIMGEQKNLYAIPAYTSECKDFIKAVEDVIENNQDEEIVFGTDIAGGSVNNDLQKIVAKRENLHLVAGINLPFILQFFTSNQGNISQVIKECIQASKEGIINFDLLDDQVQDDELDSFENF